MGIVGWGKSGLRRTLIEVVGWALVIVGIAALVLPGPGLLMMFAGIVVLSQQYTWAERAVEPMKVKAFEAAEIGVRTWPRILASAFAGCCIIAIGIVWGNKPSIPSFDLLGFGFGPELPFAGWVTGSSLILSGLIAVFLLAYSVRRFRYAGRASARQSRPPQ